jgi:hypothetical protein
MYLSTNDKRMFRMPYLDNVRVIETLHQPNFFECFVASFLVHLAHLHLHRRTVVEYVLVRSHFFMRSQLWLGHAVPF